MTNAIKQYELSKLDIFTPNRLHPTLPPLAHGEYSVMGGVATSEYDQRRIHRRTADMTVIYEPDLVNRRDNIHERLSASDRNDAQLRKRVRRHDTLIMHMEVGYSAACKRWYHNPRQVSKGGEEKSVRASMETKDSRDEFVRKGLEQEKAAMRIDGGSHGTAIELD